MSETLVWRFLTDNMDRAMRNQVREYLFKLKQDGYAECIDLKEAKKTANTVVKPANGIYSQDFESFWAMVPNKIGKGNAYASWEKAIKRGHTPSQIVKGVGVYIAYETARVKSGNSEYSPLHPATWLNGDRFLDDQPQDPREPKKSKTQVSVEKIEGILNTKVDGSERVILNECLSEGLTPEIIKVRLEEFREGDKFSEWICKITEEINK